MQSENREEEKSNESVHKNVNMSQKPNTVKYLYFDKDGRQLSEMDVKGNVVLTSGTRDDSNRIRPNPSADTTQCDSKETPSQQVKVKAELSVKQEKIIVPNFQASHNGQIYLVTPDGRLRPTIEGIDLEVGDKSKNEKPSKVLVMPGTNMQYRSRGINYLNRNGKVKRPMNAFMLWAREFRGKLAEQMPNASNAEISVGLGQVWANLPASEKQYFYLEAERVKNQHRKDFPGWVYQPNISKREIQKDVQHSRMWQRFVNTKETDANKNPDKGTAYRPIASAAQQNQQSVDITSAPSSIVADDSRKSQQAVTATPSTNSNTKTKTEVKSTLHIPTLDQQKQQQESKIDAKTILSTVKQVVVPSSLQPRNNGNTFQTFSQFKQEVLSSEKLRNVSKSSQVKPGERIAKVTAPSIQPVLQRAPVVTTTQLKTQPTAEVQARTKLTNQINTLGRPNSFVMKYNYIPESRSVIPSTTPLVSSTTKAKPVNQVQVNQPTQQNFMSLETQKTLSQRSVTMVNESISQQNTHPRQQKSQQPKQTTSNELKSNSTDNIQLPIAIPTLPNMSDKTDTLWPFPFPPVEQTPQTHLLYEGTVPDSVNSKTDLSDPYAPFYFDNYVNQVRSTELQVDVNGWQQYLNDDNASGTDKQPVCYFSNVKRCPSDLEICPSPASYTLSRNRNSNTTAGAAPTVSAANVHRMSNLYLSQNLQNSQQSATSSCWTKSTSMSESHNDTLLQPTSLSGNPTIKQQQTVAIKGLHDTGINNSQVPQESDIEMTPVQTLTGNLIPTTPQNFGDYALTINPMNYADDIVYQCDPASNVNVPKDQEKTESMEFGSIMSNAVKALHGDLDVYNAAPEQYQLSEYNESVPYMNPQLDVPPLYVQPSGSNENCHIFKYQEENNRPIKKRSYKIIEGLLENEVWRAKFYQNKSASTTTQLQNVAASTTTQLQNVTASTTTRLQNVAASTTTQLQNVTASTTTQLQNVAAPTTTQLQNVTASTTTQLQNVAASTTTQLQNVAASTTTQLQNITASTPIQLQNVTASTTTQLQNIAASMTTQLQSDTASTTTQLQNMAASTTTLLQNDTTSTPIPLQNVTASTFTPLQNVTTSTPLQNVTASFSMPLQNVTASTPTPLQKVSASFSTPLQNVTASFFTPLQNVTASTPTPLQNVSASFSMPLKNVTASFAMPLQNVTASFAMPLQNVTASTSTPLQNVTASFSTPLQNVTASTPTPLQNVTASTFTPLQNVTTSTPLQNVIASFSTPLQNVTASTPTPLQNVSASFSMPLQNVTASFSTPLQNVTASTSTPLHNVAASTPIPLHNVAASTPTPLQNVTASFSTPLQYVTASISTPLQNVTASTPTPLQNVTASFSTPLQYVTASTSTPLQNIRASTPIPLANVTNDCVSQDRVQIHSEERENEASCHTAVRDNHISEKHDDSNVTTNILQKVDSDVAHMSASQAGPLNETQETGEYVELLLGLKADNVNSREQNQSETTVIYDTEYSKDSGSLDEEVAELEVKRTENYEILVETKRNDHNGSNLQDDMEIRPAEKSGVDDEEDSSKKYSEVEIVIDNAEELSVTSCEEKYYSSNLSEAVSETTDDGGPREVKEEVVKDNVSESLPNQGESLNSKNMVIYSNMQQNPKDDHEQLKCSNKFECTGDHSNLESGDAPRSVKDIALETKNKSTRSMKSVNKKRHQYNSPVRASKRHKQ